MENLGDFMKHFKRWIVLTLVILMVFSVGCVRRSHQIQNGKIYDKDGLLQGDYQLFDGQYNKRLDLEEGNRITFGFAVGTMRGELSAYFVRLNSDEKILIEDNLIYEVSQGGTYRIEVIANQHSGAFAIEWRVD